jgi:hypothetical protein
MKSTKRFTTINYIESDLKHHGIVPMTVFVTEDQYSDIIKLKMDLTLIMQDSLSDDIECYKQLAETDSEAD